MTLRHVLRLTHGIHAASINTEPLGSPTRPRKGASEASAVVASPLIAS